VANDALYVAFNTGSWNEIKTSQVFRDPASWYHIVVAMDTTQSTAGNRTKIYVNGTQVTDFSAAAYVTQNDTIAICTSGKLQAIGAYAYDITAANDRIDGYLAEINFVDGSQLAPANFGETSNTTGQWVPIKYSGSYGTNGFYIKGEDSSDLGNDSSGNNNDFTTSGLAAADQMLDTPTNNFCVWNILAPETGTAAYTFSDGNLFADITGFDCIVNSTFTFDITDSGGWYAEVTIGTGSYNAGNWLVGLNNNPSSRTTGSNVQNDTNLFFFLGNGSKKNGSGETTGVGAALSAGDTVMLLM